MIAPCPLDLNKQTSVPAAGRSLSARNGLCDATNSERSTVANLPERAVRQGLIHDLVGDGEHAWRNSDAESLRGLQIDHQFELGRQHHRQIGSFSPLRM